MRRGNYNEIMLKINEKIDEIFRDYDLLELSSMDKRRIIFDYLCDTLSYDYELYDKLVSFALSRKNAVSRDLCQEFMNVLDNEIGICNAISQVYLLLLKHVGVKSYTVWCDDGTSVNHQLNLVYDEDSDTYSLDDVTGVIVGRGSKDDFFGYDMEDASKLGEGNRNLIGFDYPWKIAPMEYLEYIIDLPLDDRCKPYCDDLSHTFTKIKRVNLGFTI